MPRGHEVGLAERQGEGRTRRVWPGFWGSLARRWEEGGGREWHSVFGGVDEGCCRVDP